jgi:preprotein translocase subunit Sss1
MRKIIEAISLVIVTFGIIGLIIQLIVVWYRYFTRT